MDFLLEKFGKFPEKCAPDEYSTTLSLVWIEMFNFFSLLWKKVFGFLNRYVFLLYVQYIRCIWTFFVCDWTSPYVFWLNYVCAEKMFWILRENLGRIYLHLEGKTRQMIAIFFLRVYQMSQCVDWRALYTKNGFFKIR